MNHSSISYFSNSVKYIKNAYKNREKYDKRPTPRMRFNSSTNVSSFHLNRVFPYAVSSAINELPRSKLRGITATSRLLIKTRLVDHDEVVGKSFLVLGHIS
jgi:hypothetical protein